MNFKSVSRGLGPVLGVALILNVSVVAAALAQNAPPPPPPVPDPGTTAQLNCIDQKSDYVQNGKTFSYVMTFENKCEARMKCAVFAYVVQAKGPSHGHTTLILGPKSQGPAAKKTYAMKIKGLGGFGTSERECRVF